jgi:hypothetical protein
MRHRVIVAVLGILLAASGCAKSGTASQAPPASSRTAVTASADASPSVSPRAAKVRHRVARKPHATASATTAHASAPAPSQIPPSVPATPQAVACYPLTGGGNCYRPGEYCRSSDHGTAGIDGNGDAIVCENNDGWRWEPA